MTTDPSPSTGAERQIPNQTSYSALVKHRRCPSAWVYQYVRRLEPLAADSPAQLVGRWWHAVRAAESLERGRLKGSLRFVPKALDTPAGPLDTDLAPFKVITEADRWWDKLPHEAREACEEALGGPMPDRLAYVFVRWKERWADDLAHEEPLAVEMFWKRPLPRPALVAPGFDMPPTMLIGYVDEVYRDRRKNVIVIRDHKAKQSLLDGQASLDDLMDSQVQLYAWGIAPILKSWGLPGAKATSFDRATMKAPKQPVITKAGNLGKTVTAFDLHTYANLSEEARTYPGGVYEIETSVLEKLGSPAERSKWFQRTLTPISKSMVRVHLQAAVDTAYDAHLTKLRTEKNAAVPVNLSRACKWCDFSDICRAEIVGGRVDDPTEFGFKEKGPRRG